MHPREHHVAFLDHVRGIAIAWVFAFHAFNPAFHVEGEPWSGWWKVFPEDWTFILVFPALFGAVGVPIFFVVSGFCIHLSWSMSRQRSWQVFFLRRFWRIYPPYLFAMIFSILLIGHRFRFTQPDDGWQFISHLFLFHNVDKTWFHGINPAFWSIAVEVQLYAIYPLVIAIVSRYGWRTGLIATGVVEFGIRATTSLIYTLDLLHIASWPELPIYVTKSPFGYWFSWTLGAYIAEQMIRGQSFSLHRLPMKWMVAMFLLCYLVKPLSPFLFPMASAITATGVSRLLQSRATALPIPKWLNRHLCWVGIISYSIYLIHDPIILKAYLLLPKFHSGSTLPQLAVFGYGLLMWVPTVLLSALMYRLVEKPSIHIGKWIVNRRT